MPNVVACYKWVVDEAGINASADGTIDLRQSTWKISDYDRNSMQLAVELAKQLGARPVGMTCGDSAVKKSFQGALARGIEEAYWVDITGLGSADGILAGQGLAAGVKQLGDTLLVLCAEGSSDVYGRQTAGRIAACLNLPLVTCVCKAWVEGDTLFAQRKLENTIETVRVQMPAVIGVLPEATLPALPSLRALVAAGKKPVTTYLSADLGLSSNNAVTLKESKAYTADRKCIVIAEEEEEKSVEVLLSHLKKEGVLP